MAETWRQSRRNDLVRTKAKANRGVMKSKKKRKPKVKEERKKFRNRRRVLLNERGRIRVGHWGIAC